MATRTSQSRFYSHTNVSYEIRGDRGYIKLENELKLEIARDSASSSSTKSEEVDIRYAEQSRYG